MGLLSRVKYAANEVGQHYDDMRWWRQRFYSRVLGPITRVTAPDGIDVMDEDWDNLLILDACRFDTFESMIGTSKFDEYRRVTSKASATPEWIRKNFQGQTFGDTVYVSGNPWVSKIAPNSFHDIKNIWLDDYDFDEDDLTDADTLANLGVPFEETVTAQRVNQAAVEAANEYDDKRLIIHYIQPHAPYIGNSDGSTKDEVPPYHPGEHLRFKGMDSNTVEGLYHENLEYVWHHASMLLEQLEGQTVVTSDHGEMFGERLFPLLPFRGYDHPIGLHSSELVTVPWATINGPRRETTDDDAKTVTVDEDAANERLRNLGYKA